jgi:methanogenic corrinoid protein MtbC1
LRSVDRGLVTIREAYEQVFEPVQRELGRMWHVNDLTVAEEHFATATTTLVMSQLYARLPRKPRHGKTALTAGIEGNTHDLGTRVVSDYLEMEGWRVVFLGANVPSSDLVECAQRFKADIVCLSAYMPAHLRTLADTIALLRSQNTTAKVLVGGPIFYHSPELWKDVGADACALTARAAVDQAKTLASLS